MRELSRIGIAGATGLIGSRLAAALGGRAVAVPRPLVADGDPVRLAAWLQAAGVGWLVNAVGASVGDWPGLFAANALAADTLARAAARAGLGCLALGSARVFDPRLARPRAEDERPDGPAGGGDLYGASKLCGEQRTLAAFAEPGAGLVLRLPMVLGWRRRQAAGQVVTRLLERAWRGQPVRVAVDAWVQVVHVDTVVKAVTVLADTDRPGGVLHLAGSGAVSLYEVLARVLAACGLPGPERAVCADFEPEAPGPRWQVLAPGRLAELVPVEPWEQAVETFAAEVLEARHG